MKNVALGLAALVVVVIALQNTGAVQTRLLLVTLMVPKVVIMLAAFLAGAAAGVLVFCGHKTQPEETQPVHRALDRSRSGDLGGSQRTR